MGDWVETCFFSNLPIEENEDVVVFLLRAKPKQFAQIGRRMCYPDDLFDPISLHLKGYYDGYGRIILDKKYSDYHKYILDNVYYRNGSLKFESTEELMDAFNEDVIEGPMYNYSKVFMKKTVYDKIISVAKQELNLDFSSQTNGFGEFETYYEALRGIISKHYKDMQALKEIKFTGPEEDALSLLKFEHMTYTEHEEKEDLLPPSIKDKFQVLLNMGLETSDDLQESFCEFILLNNLLSETRKTWSLPSGSGSHNQNWGLLATLNTELAEVFESEVENRIKRYVEDEFGDNPESFKDSDPITYSEYLQVKRLDFIEKAYLVSSDF